jgi:predicted RNA binding protein with dsRBD fold (UPF0201 family)
VGPSPFAAELAGGSIMVRLEVTAEEAEKLSEILENYLSDLRMEIVDTESQDFRQGLKKTKDLLLRIVDQLKVLRP